MMFLRHAKFRRGHASFLVGMVFLLATGCHAIPQHEDLPIYAMHDTPREQNMTLAPPYIIEPPDLLLIEGVSITPRVPYHLRTSDVISVQAPGAFADSPIQGAYAVMPGGVIDLGIPYGTVTVGGMTIEQARDAISAHLSTQLADSKVIASLGQIASMQQVQGEHLVKQDGTVRLGTYGSVLVAGLTIDQAEAAVEQHLAQFLDTPDVSLDIFAFNSKWYYVIMQGAGLGDQITKLPFTGNETVLDAITQVGGLQQVSSKRIWIARPGPTAEVGCKILPVDYNAITRFGDISTNYQILPGDRIFVAQDPLIAFDNQLAKLIAPVERVAGFMLLGVNTVTRFSGRVLAGGGQQFNNFGGFQ